MFSEELGQKNYGFKLGGKRFVFKIMKFRNNQKMKFDVYDVPEEPPEVIENLPGHYNVCTEGCDTWTDDTMTIPCGRCGAPMKAKDFVY